MAKQSAPFKVMGLLRIREDLAEKVGFLLEDPMRPGNIKYGSLRVYLERLIAEDLVVRGALAQKVLDEIVELENAD